MKAVLDLTKAIKNRSYYDDQFKGQGLDKNILFVSPQLTSKHLYKFILPFFSFYNERIHTAITDLSKYKPFEQIVALDTTLTSKEILWADFIVFPFTTMDLSKQNGLYEAIREVNPNCRIVFFIDFNYYALPDEHPHKELFDFPNILASTEMNVLMADLCLVSSLNLQGYLLQKFTELAHTKYKHIKDIPVVFNAIPYLIDDEIVLQNVDFEFNKPESVLKNKEMFKKVAEVAEEIKKDDLSSNKQKAKKLANSKSTPKKEYEKTNKVVAKKGRKKKSETETIDMTEGGEVGVNESTVPTSVSTVATSETTVPTNVSTLATNISTVPTTESIIQTEGIHLEQYVELPKKYRVGIICSPNNYADIKVYNDDFKKINQRYGDNVTLIFVGYDYKEDTKKILDGVDFEYTEQVSIIQYFKQLQSLELDLIFVPLDRNVYNATSENINKYLEASLFNIPLITEDIFPYDNIILNERNGFIYKGKQNFITAFEKILLNPDLIRAVSIETKNDVFRNYRYTDANIDVISSVYN